MEHLAKEQQLLDKARAALVEADQFDDETVLPLDAMLSSVTGDDVPGSIIHEASAWGMMSTLVSVLVLSALDELQAETRSLDSLAKMVIFSTIYALNFTPNSALVEGEATESAVTMVAMDLAETIASKIIVKVAQHLREAIMPIVTAINEVYVYPQ